LVSGKNVDKSKVFEVFYGELKTAPMVATCPLSIECKLVDVYQTKTHELFIGEVVNSYADDSCLTNGKVDLAKVDPLLFDMNTTQYWSLGNPVGKCWNAGKIMLQPPEQANK
jgi:flavin reductase (DIM6/NTAB) family NADH-FMN oxidoreductase RutF